MQEPTEQPKLETVQTNLFDFSLPSKSSTKKSKRDKKEKKSKKSKKDKKKSKKSKSGLTSNTIKFPFSYEQMLERINHILEKNNPYSEDTKKLKLKPIQFDKISSKKYKWSNFREFAASLNRKAEHMAQFVGVGLGIEPILQEEALLLEGRRFDKDSLQTITRKYILEYVKCPFCSSTSTILYKDSSIREFILKCDACKSSKTMTAIKGGSKLAKKK